jgi:hypothetical protein
MSSLQTYQTNQHRLECFLCGKANSLNVTECGECMAPMDISETAADGRIPRIFTMIGAPGVGKSVYLGMLLDSLARQRDRSEVTCFGPSASQLQQSVVSALTRGEFPNEEANLDWTWAHCQLSRSTRKTPLEIYLPDFPGLAIIEDYENRRSWPAIRQAIAKSAGAMLFVDGAAASRGDKDEEFFALQLLRHYTTIRKQEPRDLESRPRKGQADSNVAIVFTKADQSDECLQRTEEFARGQLPGLWQFCQDQFPCHKFFAATVVGACVTVKDCLGYKTEVPLRVEPQGILEPFRWLLGKVAA